MTKKKDRIPLKGGDEYDALTTARKFYVYLAHSGVAKKIKKMMEKEEKSIVPDYDPTLPPIININQITRILPHRYPFLLVDRVIEISEKNITIIRSHKGLAISLIFKEEDLAKTVFDKWKGI